jgi:hypothetical protein
MSSRTWLPIVLLATGCTTLGPMPATTGISAVPANRPGAELQAGIMPAFFLSDAAHANYGHGAPTRQISALIEPDRLLGTKGLVIGARSWGETGDSPFEPMVGLRRRVDDRFSVAGFAYGTHAHGAEQGASYIANRFGGELAIDAELIPVASWLGIHVQATASATYVDAHGTYCVAPDGEGIDCHDTSRRVDGTIEGVYTAATAGVSLDLARRSQGYLHDIRLALLGAVGAMPRIRDGVQQPSNDQYRSIGLSLTIGIGDER